MACDIIVRVVIAFDFREIVSGVVVGGGGGGGGGCGGFWVSPGGLVGGGGTGSICFLAGGAGVIGGVFDAEGGVGPSCACGVLPQLGEIKNGGERVVDATLGSFIGELQREFLAVADLVLEIEAGVINVEVDIAIWKLGCKCWVEILGTEDVEVQLISVVVTGATCTAHCLHWAKELGQAADGDGLDPSFVVHHFDEEGTCRAA